MRCLLALAALCVAGCDDELPLPPVVVFVAGEDSQLAERFAEFTTETGITVDARSGDSAKLVDALIHKTGAPADVLISNDLGDVWRATDRGALRPIQSTAFESQQAFLKDPDGYWAALKARSIAIFHHDEVRPITFDVGALGQPAFAGKVCLPSLDLPISRALIASLIEDRGVRQAERLVRRWVRNLAKPPMESEAKLLGAIGNGECEYGIASIPNKIEGAIPLLVEPHLISITAIGIGRHARNPEGAQQLVDWLVSDNAAVFRSESEFMPRPTHVAGYLDEEARLLAERAGYR